MDDVRQLRLGLAERELVRDLERHGHHVAIVGQRRAGEQDEVPPARQAADDFGGSLLARKLAEELFDVLNLERALLEIVLRDVILHENQELYTTRRQFLQFAAAFSGVRLQPDADQTSGKPRASEFVFARLRYESGDWDYNPKVAANVLDSVVQYTSIPVYKDEVVIAASSTELLSFPFVFMTGHTLVRFTAAERGNLRRFADAGGLLFSDDCNHDVNGLYAKSFEQEMRATFPDAPLEKLSASHPLFRSFFTFAGGPPQTSHELNGWGDNLVHEYLKGIERRGRLAVLYSNKDYGCEWDYDWRNKRFLREDNTKFAVNLVVYAMSG